MRSVAEMIRPVKERPRETSIEEKARRFERGGSRASTQARLDGRLENIAIPSSMGVLTTDTRRHRGLPNKGVVSEIR